MNTTPASHSALQGKTALITGSTSGIGLGLARVFAQNGAKILLNGFATESQRQALEQELGQYNQGQVCYLPADMRHVNEIELLMQQAGSEGGVDILVNNAGVQYVAPVDQFPTEKWDDIIALNLSSAFHTTRLALTSMRQKNWGRIINIASVHGCVASKDKSAYVAAKHGLVGFTKVVALETATTGITCNAICPGFVFTPLIEAQIHTRMAQKNMSFEAAKNDLLQEKQPSLEFVSIDQVADLALYLCGNSAAQIRGAIWNMDGGWMAQ